MRQYRWNAVVLVAILLCHVTSAAPSRRIRRQSELAVGPVAPEEISFDGETELTREKRKLEGVTQFKFSAKNALLGFLFGKVNQLIDFKSHQLAQLDQFNIAKNKAYGIVVPESGFGIGNLVSSFTASITPKIQLIGPAIQLVTSKIGGLSNKLSGAGLGLGVQAGVGAPGGGGGLGGGLGGLLGGLSGGLSGGANAGISLGGGGDSSASASASTDTSGGTSGLGSLLSTVFRLSGPLLSSVSASAGGGVAADSDSSDE